MELSQLIRKKSLYILGKKYRIEHKALEDSSAEYCPVTNRICINNVVVRNEENKLHALLHEFFHAVVDALNIELVEEENTVDGLALALSDFLLRNKILH
jgi:hypothetical protein